MRGLMELGAGLSNWIRPSPVDQGAQPAGLGCSETASQPLSQILWPFHTQPRPLAADRAQHCCDPGGPDRAPQPGANLAVQAKPKGLIEHQHEPQPRRLYATHPSVLDELPDEGADAAPKQHPQSMQAEEARADQLHRVQLGLESNRSSRQVAKSRRHIIDEVKELLKAHQFDGLRDAGVPYKLKGTFGIGALLCKLNQST